MRCGCAADYNSDTSPLPGRELTGRAPDGRRCIGQRFPGLCVSSRSGPGELRPNVHSLRSGGTSELEHLFENGESVEHRDKTGAAE
jgi:hypothetical protein